MCAGNRTSSKVDDFLADQAKGTTVVGSHSMEEMCAKLKKPRRVVILVKAGAPVDQTIEQLVPHMEAGDIIVDGGNSHFPDSDRRQKELEAKGLLFIGSGVSGGEEGARYGPSIMPGGSAEAWPHVRDIFQAISAKAGDEPCCDWLGSGGSGHYVKMVHNGIEYGDMQMICEAYHLMKDALDMSNDEMASTFEEWDKGELDSYLIDITAQILRHKEEDGSYTVDKVLDCAGQKGTGKWTAISALDLGMPVTLIGEAVFSRCLSALKDQRVRASEVLKGPGLVKTAIDKATFLEYIRKALYAAKIVSYAQGFMELREASTEYKWGLNFGSCALMWRGGCIIRSVFLGEIKAAFEKNPELECLLLDDFFKAALEDAQLAWRQVVAQGALLGVPLPAISTALNFYDGYRTARMPANLLQSQRDFFGAHTYERVDKPRGEFFHTDWTGRGGKISSSTYNQ